LCSLWPAHIPLHNQAILRELEKNIDLYHRAGSRIETRAVKVH
jgi:hypothetical protein